MAVEDVSIIDESILDSYRVLQDEGQPDIVTEFIDVYLEDIPSRMDRLRKAVAERNVAEIRSAAHAIKGSSGSVGAVLVSGVCAQLESNARAGSADGSDRLFTDLEGEMSRANQELQRHRKP